MSGFKRVIHLEDGLATLYQAAFGGMVSTVWTACGLPQEKGSARLAVTRSATEVTCGNCLRSAVRRPAAAEVTTA